MCLGPGEHFASFKHSRSRSRLFARSFVVGGLKSRRDDDNDDDDEEEARTGSDVSSGVYDDARRRESTPRKELYHRCAVTASPCKYSNGARRALVKQRRIKNTLSP